MTKRLQRVAETVHRQAHWLLPGFVASLVALNWGRWSGWGIEGFTLYLTQPIMQTTLYDFAWVLGVSRCFDLIRTQRGTIWRYWYIFPTFPVMPAAGLLLYMWLRHRKLSGNRRRSAVRRLNWPTAHSEASVYEAALQDPRRSHDALGSCGHFAGARAEPRRLNAPAPPLPADATPMKAIVSRCYGPPDVLSARGGRNAGPRTRGPGRVRAAAVNPLDWHYMRGKPYVMRMDRVARRRTPHGRRLRGDGRGGRQERDRSSRVTRCSAGERGPSPSTSAFVRRGWRSSRPT